jgi:hypothetical protein
MFETHMIAPIQINILNFEIGGEKLLAHKIPSRGAATYI